MIEVLPGDRIFSEQKAPPQGPADDMSDRDFGRIEDLRTPILAIAATLLHTSSMDEQTYCSRRSPRFNPRSKCCVPVIVAADRVMLKGLLAKCVRNTDGEN